MNDSLPSVVRCWGAAGFAGWLVTAALAVAGALLAGGLLDEGGSDLSQMAMSVTPGVVMRWGG
jgi:hypothetical protein